MLKVHDVPLVLDEAEKGTVKEFVKIIAGTGFSLQLVVLIGQIRRMPDGTLVVPVSLSGATQSLSLALFMNHKTDQLYKQTSCRVRLAQCPVGDTKKGMYLWGGSDWEALP